MKKEKGKERDYKSIILMSKTLFLTKDILIFKSVVVYSNWTHGTICIITTVFCNY